MGIVGVECFLRPHGVREPGSGNRAAAGSSPAGGMILPWYHPKTILESMDLSGDRVGGFGLRPARVSTLQGIITGKHHFTQSGLAGCAAGILRHNHASQSGWVGRLVSPGHFLPR